MRIEVMLDWSLHVVPIVLCGYKVILMILFEYRQTSTLSHLGIPSLLLSSPPLSSSPSICASFSASQPQSFTEISGESTLLVSSETVFFKEPKSGLWGGPPEDQSLRQMLTDPQKSHSSSSAKTLILKVRSCPAHPCCVLTLIPQKDMLKP